MIIKYFTQVILLLFGKNCGVEIITLVIIYSRIIFSVCPQTFLHRSGGLKFVNVLFNSFYILVKITWDKNLRIK